MRARESITVLNTPCVLTTKQGLADDIAAWCSSSGRDLPLSVDFTNVHIVAMRTTDPDFYENTSSVDWFVSDSQILSWAVTLMGGESHARVYGPDFMDHFFRHGDRTITHYFLGASDACLDALDTRLSEIQPGYRLIGSHNGYFDRSKEPEIIEDINRLGPDIVWVGLGTPKQQEWIHRNKPLLNCKALLAVGFAFDVNAGTKKDAPAWLGPLGLTWLYRLASEPRRLWKRYLVYNSVFLGRLAVQHFSGKPCPPPDNSCPAAH